MSEPFLKWAGGKRWLVASGLFPTPDKYSRFIEPFVGGGAIFFHLSPKAAVISDLNEDLIELYKTMRDSPEELHAEMACHQSAHSDNYYYKTRNDVPETPLARAARFLYLNRTCWNGLYRVNLAGRFNVPRGTKDTVLFEGENFLTFSQALKGADIRCSDFEEIIDEAEKGDFLFVDPPYTVKHNVNGFLKYNEKIFRWEDQIRLKNSIDRATKRGAYVVMTNADHQSVRDLYADVLDYASIERHSVLAGAASRRGLTTEALFTFGI